MVWAVFSELIRVEMFRIDLTRVGLFPRTFRDFFPISAVGKHAMKDFFAKQHPGKAHPPILAYFPWQIPG